MSLTSVRGLYSFSKFYDIEVSSFYFVPSIRLDVYLIITAKSVAPEIKVLLNM
jgi:hypothetical protein